MHFFSPSSIVQMSATQFSNTFISDSAEKPIYGPHVTVKQPTSENEQVFVDYMENITNGIGGMQFLV